MSSGPSVLIVLALALIGRAAGIIVLIILWREDRRR